MSSKSFNQKQTMEIPPELEQQIPIVLASATQQQEFVCSQPQRTTCVRPSNDEVLNEIVHDHQETTLPWQRLPSELLSEIFISAIPTRYFDPGFPWKDSNYKITFALSQVCGYWRTVALATPQIWSSIPAIYSHQLGSRSLNAFVTMFIRRSGSVPLHITLLLVGMKAESWTQGNLSLLPPLLDSIFSQSYRWKSAIIRVTNAVIEIPRHTFPILDSLNFYYRRDATHDPPPYNVGHTPSLRHAILDGPKNQMSVPWNQLWSYVGRTVDPDLLRLASTQLRTCVLRGTVCTDPRPSDIILFPKLTSLRIINRCRSLAYWGVTETILRWIAAPVLENLEVSAIFGLWSHPSAPLVVADLLMTTLTWPSTTLRSITFHVPGMTKKAFRKLLYAVPYLTMLDIRGVPVPAIAYLDVGAAQTPNGPTEPLVPHLQSLTIHGISHLDLARIWAVYDSRSNAKCEDMKIARLSIILRYRSLRACHQAQRLIVGETSDINDLNLGRALSWSTHLVKNFLTDFPDRRKKYTVPGERAKRLPGRREIHQGLNIFFTRVIEQQQFSDPAIIELSRIARILSDIRDLPPTDILNDNDYNFRQRAGKVVESWAPLLEDFKSHQRWILGEDYMTLKAHNPSAVVSIDSLDN